MGPPAPREKGTLTPTGARFGHCVAIAALSLATACVAPLQADLLIDNVTVYSGADVAPFRANVAVHGGVFIAIDRERRTRVRAAERIGGQGLYVTPGLWDMHTHIRASEGRGLDLGAFLRHGVTSVRDLGGLVERIRSAQDDIAAGRVAGPHVYAAYSTLNGEVFAPFQRVVSTAAEAVGAVAEMAALGAVQVKIHRAVPPSLLPVILREAHARGLRVTGHIPLGLHPLQACELGMDGIEHIGSFLEAYISVTPEATSAQAFQYLLSEAADPLYRCLAERRVEVTPTLVVYAAVARAWVGNGPMPADFAEFMGSTGQVALRLQGAGVPMLSGTDTTTLEVMTILPGSSLLDELEMLQAAGIAARDIIPIATVNAARALGVEARTGSIEVGQDADFLLLGSDPGTDVRNFRNLVATYRGGQRVDRQP